MTSASRHRAALLGLAIAVVGCDIAAFALDPQLPSFEQTWNLPGTEKTIGLSDLLPPGNVVSILPDSSGFSLSMSPTNISRVVGADCAPCVPLNGTNAPKPAFVLNAGNSTALPQDVVSAAITAGQIQINLVNNLSFDPIYVNTAPAAPTQGYLVIVVRSGSVVFARDSIRGAAVASGVNNGPWPKNGGVLNRTIPISSGTATTNLTVDITIDSPQGDHNEFINSNATINAAASVPSMVVGSVTMNVPPRTINTGGGDLPLKEIPGAKDMHRATLLLDFVNPFTGVTGTDTARFVYGPLPGDVIVKTLTLPSGTGSTSITLDSADVKKLIEADSVVMTIRGPVSSPTPITVTPTQSISITARLLAVIRTPTTFGGK
jgi:hypothetical protein